MPDFRVDVIVAVLDEEATISGGRDQHLPVRATISGDLARAHVAAGSWWTHFL